MPKVSIVIPAYRDREGLKRLLDSVYAQDFRDFDVFVSDDTENDGLKDVCDGRPGLTYVNHSDNKNGAGANWNNALSMADGEYVKIMHGDDFFTFPDSLGKLVKLLDEDPGAVMAFSGTRQMPETGEPYDRHTPEKDVTRFRRDPRSLFTVGNTIGSPSAVLVRRSDVRYDERLTWLVDMEYYIHLLTEGDSSGNTSPAEDAGSSSDMTPGAGAGKQGFVCTDEPLISIGMSDRQLTRSVSTDEGLVANERRIIAEKYGLREKPSFLRDATPEGLLFYAGLTLEILWLLLDKSSHVIESEGILFRISFIPLFLSVLIGFVKRKYGKRDCLTFAAFFLLGTASYLSSSRNDILRILFLVFATRNASPRRYLRYTFFLTLSGCAVIALLSVTGAFGSAFTLKEVNADVTRQLLTLGMGHPNSLYAMFFALTALGLYIWYDRVSLSSCLLILLSGGILFLLTACRLGFICTLLSVCFTMAMKKSRALREGKGFYLTASVLIAAMVLSTLLIAKYGEIYNSYDPPWFEPHFESVMKPLDRFFSGRLWMAYGFPDSDISSFSLLSSPENERYVDLGFYKLFYWYGYLPGAVYVMLCLGLLYTAWKRKDPALGVFVAVWCFYNFMEAHEISDYIGRNYIWLILYRLPWLFPGRQEISEGGK